jgi:hypothetical protein
MPVLEEVAWNYHYRSWTALIVSFAGEAWDSLENLFFLHSKRFKIPNNQKNWLNNTKGPGKYNNTEMRKQHYL